MEKKKRVFHQDAYDTTTIKKQRSQSTQSIGYSSDVSLKMSSGITELTNPDSCNVLRDLTNLGCSQRSTHVTQPLFYSNCTATGTISGSPSELFFFCIVLMFRESEMGNNLLYKLMMQEK